MRNLYYIFKLFDRAKTFLLTFIEEKKTNTIRKLKKYMNSSKRVDIFFENYTMTITHIP